MRWSFFLLNDDTRCLFWGVNYRNTEAKIIIKKKTMRLDALIIFLIEWRHTVMIWRGKQSKYWRQKMMPDTYLILRMRYVYWETLTSSWEWCMCIERHLHHPENAVCVLRDTYRILRMRYVYWETLTASWEWGMCMARHLPHLFDDVCALHCPKCSQ